MIKSGSCSAAIALCCCLLSQPAGASPIVVPATGETVYSDPLAAGTPYLLEATGVFTFAMGGAVGDAAWATWTGNWDDRFPCPWLHVNDQVVQWQGTTDGITFATGVYSPQHIYRLEVVGDGNPLGLRIEDSLHLDNYGDLQVTITEIPEPATLALLTVGGAGMILRRRRERNR